MGLLSVGQFPAATEFRARLSDNHSMVSPALRPSIDHARGPDLAGVAASLGVVDALLFRRVSRTRWAHLGGLGRGRGWAGIIDVDEAEDRLASRIPATVGEVRRTWHDEPARVLGPYYAAGSAVIRASTDLVVVVGNPGAELSDAADEDFLRLANLLDAAVDDVLPSKRLADELELLHTVRDLMAAPIDGGLEDTLRHVVQIAVNALSCDVGVLRDGAGALVVVRAGEDAGAPTDGQWHTALDEISAMVGDEDFCAQDRPAMRSLSLVTVLPAIRSLLAVRVPPPIGGILLMLHTARGPRGFTGQCRRLGRHIVDTGSVVARTAVLRDELHAAADRQALAARTDPLTGLGNRLAWDEALADAQERLEAGQVASVLTLDVDGLKQINDRYGHPAGDDLLRRCASAIRRHAAPGETAVRMGGDEFAILLPADADAAARRYAALATELGGSASSIDMVAASIGVSTAQPGGSVSDAVREADVQMYRHKRARRRPAESGDPAP